jgi:gamma-glutamyltranspeptidase / glutathione hydrolase
MKRILGTLVLATLGPASSMASSSVACSLVDRFSEPVVSQTSPPEPPPFVRTYSGGAVAADHALASKAGADMLRRGGNAVDAAAAASFALSVARPFSCGIGGGGFMVIRLAGPGGHKPTIEVALNYREQAPACAGPDSYERLVPTRPDAATRGGTAVAIPGTTHGLLHALSTYGTLDRATVLAPAIAAAEHGFVVDEAYLRGVREDVLPAFDKDPELRARFAFVWTRFLREGKVALGDTIALPEQASALRLIAARGADAFTTGPLADAIIASIVKDGGAMTHADLASFRVQTLEPLRTAWMGCRVLTMPPPSSGGLVLAQVFATLAARPTPTERLADLGHNSAAYVHLIAEASKHAFADRARWLADPAFVTLPMNELLDPAMLAGRAASIKPDGVSPDDAYGWRPGPAAKPQDDGGTSHVSVVDAAGNAVACTETINLIFGSWLAVEGYGFCLNNEMDDFLTVRGRPNAFGLAQADANLPAPGKRPLSSMTPTILVNPDGTVRAVVGASGGPRIISGTLQAILNHTVFGMDAGQAVASPRFHHQWSPATLGLEPDLHKSPEPGIGLRAHGHQIKPRPWADVGVVQMITAGPGGWTAASDPRKGGVPDGTSK